MGSGQGVMKRAYEFNKSWLVLLMGMLICSFSGCGGGSSGDSAPPTVAPLSARNINLIFVVSPDLAYHAPGDVAPSTANLTDQGLQRSLLMPTYLKAGGAGDKEREPHLRARTDDPFADRQQLPRYGGTKDSPKLTSDLFFFDPKFSDQTVLLAWEHEHIPPTIGALLARYFPAHKVLPVPDWPSSDFDTIWTVTLDVKGNLTVTNALCEGIDSAKLPVTAPHF